MKTPGVMVPADNGLVLQFAVFASMGAVGTMVHYSILLASVEWAGLASVIGSAIGFVAGALVNYALNHRFTFRSSASHRVALPRFMTVAMVGFCLNGLFMMAGTRWLPLHYLVVQLLATGAVLLWGFAANLLWTFKRSTHGHE